MAYSGIKSSAVGIRYATRTDELSGPAPFQRSRTSAYAPRLAAKSETAVATVETMIVFRYHLGNSVLVNRKLKCSSVQGVGQNMFWICWICSVLLNAVTKMK